MLKSLKKTSSIFPELLIINTSTSEESESILFQNKIPFINLKGGIHGEGVNLGLLNISTRYVLLVDTDIIFMKDFNPAFKIFKSNNLALMGKVVGDCAGKLLYERVEPWYCFIDLQQLKEHNITFFDSERTKNSKLQNGKIYDVGSTMFEDVINSDLIVGNVDMENKYFKHYGGMSWRIQKYNPNDIDTDIDFGGTHPNKMLYDYGMSIKSRYDNDTEYLNNIEL